MVQQYQQGDVLLEMRQVYGVRSIEDYALRGGGKLVDVQRSPSRVLVRGERTGHAHVLEANSAEEAVAYVEGLIRGRRLVAVGSKGATLKHEEHDPVAVPEGIYEVVEQRQYTGPQAQGSRSSALWD